MSSDTTPEQTQVAVDAMKAEAAHGTETATAPSIESAVADLKRQLRNESKSELIRQWIGLYAQIINMAQANELLKRELIKIKTEASASVSSEAEASEGVTK